MAGAPDVRVRLSLEGQAEIFDLFKRMQAEAVKSGRASAQGLSPLNSALGNLRDVIGLVTTALAGIGLSRLVNDASNAAERLQNLHQVYATNVRDLNALDVALRRSGSSLEEQNRAMATFLEKTKEASGNGGIGQAADAFKDLGLSTKEIRNFANQNVGQRLETVARAWVRMGEGVERSDAAVQIFGTRTTALIPILDLLGTKGFGGLHEQAAQLAADLDPLMVDAIGKVNDSFDDMAIASRGLASQFLVGISEPLSGAVRVVVAGARDSQGAWQEIGRGFGNLLAGMTIGLADFLDQWGTFWRSIGFATAAVGKAVAAAATLNFTEAEAHLQAIALHFENESAALFDRSIARRLRFVQGSEEGARARPGQGGEADATAREARELSSARREAARAGLDAELRETQQKQKLREEADERSYARGLLDVKEYYSRKRLISVQSIDAELNLIDARRAKLTEEEPKKRLTEEVKIDAEIRRLKLERSAEIERLDQKEFDEVKRLNNQRLDLDRQVFEARGQQYQAALIQIDQMIEKTRVDLRQSGLTKDETEARVGALRAALTTQAEFNELARKAQLEFQGYTEERARIQDQVDAGLLTQIEGEEKISAIQRRRLAGLRQISDALGKAAEKTGDQARIGDAQAFGRGVDQLGLAVQRHDDSLARIRTGTAEALTSGLIELSTTGAAAAESFSGAMSNMVQGVIRQLQRLAAELLFTRAVAGLFGLFGGGGGKGPNIGPISLPALPKIPVPAGALGGRLRGPGTGTSDSILMRGSTDEFLTRSRIARQPGVYAFLDALNRGVPEVLDLVRSVGTSGLPAPAFASSGGGGSGGAARLDGTVTIGLEEGLILRALETPAGQRSVLRAVIKHRRGLGRALGSR